MKIRVLGCHGATTPDHKNTCFMLGDHLAVDAGNLGALTLEEQAVVDDILLSSAAMDHVMDLGAFADNVAHRRKAPVNVHCTQHVADQLKKHFFNGTAWPDFTNLPSAAAPALKFRPHGHGKKFQVQDLEVTFLANVNTGDTSSMVIKGDAGSIVFSGDTGPGIPLWDHVNKLKDVRALFVECTLPTSLQKQADTMGHLTPATMASELKKLAVAGFPIFAYHLKPATYAETRKELRALKMRELHLARVGDIYEV